MLELECGSEEHLKMKL